jgi:dCMP deaminase
MDLDKIDTYMKMAHEVKGLSPDAETKVGAIMLSSQGRIIASSFNGFLRGAPDDKLPNSREGSPNKHEFIQHAERNMLYNCSYEGIRTKDTTIVCTLSPCLECLRACFQSGVKTIIFDELYHKFPDTDFYERLPDVYVFVGKKGDYTVLEMMSVKDYLECLT